MSAADINHSFIHLLIHTRQQITSTKHTERLKTYTILIMGLRLLVFTPLSLKFEVSQTKTAGSKTEFEMK